MPFIPHTAEETRAMLAAIGVDGLDDLFDEIPTELRVGELEAIPAGMSEMEVSALMEQRAREDGQPLMFIGAGAYDHHIPAAVWQLAGRGEFYSAYTPYQAEASQGTLQLLYEYQSMMTALTAMDVSNASLYDGASALAEAILMAVRLNRKSSSRKVLVPRSLHPAYRKVAHNIVRNQGIELVEIPFDKEGGHTDPAALEQYSGQDITALVIPQPNFFGVLEEVDALTDWAARSNAISVGVVNPLALAILSPPGEWGEKGVGRSQHPASRDTSPSLGVDICCGEGQPLGIPLSSGGPYFGFLCCREAHVRQMPGRIIGRTLDLDGKPGFTLTLQAREQHIRRSKATSNICTNQGLMVTAATIHMALLGAEGLARAAAASHANSLTLNAKLSAIAGVEPLFSRPCFHERPFRLAAPVREVLRSLAAHNVLGGYDLGRDYPELGEALLVCATEKRTLAEMDQYADKLGRVLRARTEPTCPTRPTNPLGADFRDSPEGVRRKEAPNKF
ncbi:MAG: aminomethyl-transferring glycine dehydrogenase subunit GcvPA [Gammaproteobacteria bacterium]|nr:aminomethyl-transferring glycine dehydrogenase subunit GcvPA [Gammaproteobacteria bacterium]MBU1655558.1 aminomethyl-transferring glycine dehydrogenase subunit GcvPA [Gammaproteobacteria bacterium]MBU1960255.1 aminomethyl-transferring glycine dehydrogenase subunit GcvPA [Gammaproteobacteria bacterium]